MYEEGDWSVKGHFQAALEDNDPIFWEKESGEYTLCVLALVSIFTCISQNVTEIVEEDESQPRAYDLHQGQPGLTQPAQQSVADYKGDLVHIFGIPSHLLRDHGKNEGGLLLYYKKYKACLAAISTSGRMAAAGEWNIRKPSDTKIVELFVGKTMWHDTLKRLFSRLPKYPKMHKWLNEEADALPALDLWGDERASYTFSDLEKWMNEKDRKSAAKGKGKAKEIVKGKKKGDGSNNDSDDSDDDEKKKKKKKKKKKNINHEF